MKANITFSRVQTMESNQYLCTMSMEDSIFKRSELLLGSEAMQQIGGKRVIIFGVGGVGSWCAESLIRSGIRHLTIVDSDRVCESNINRQLMATTLTVGQVKVDALRERLLSINPSAEIITIVFGFTLLPETYNMLMFVLPPGAFITLGFLVAVINRK